MKILYIHQYYNTPEKGGPLRSYYISRAFKEAGHDVEIITSHNHDRYQVEDHNGITVHFLPIKYSNAMGFLARAKAFLTFMRQAKKLALSIKDVDLCYATSTPLTIGNIAMYLKKKKGIPYIFEVRDLWPEAPIQMGAIKSKWLKKYLYRLEKKIYQKADKIIALSPGIRDYIRQIVPHQEIGIVSNMSDCEYFQPTIKNKQLLSRFDINNELVVTYFGAIGKVNRLQYLIDAAKETYKKYGMDVRFLIVGEGGMLEEHKKSAKGLKNLQFVGFQNRDQIKALLSITDISFISFDNKPVLETSSPNKFFDSLAAAKVCAINFNGWIKDLIEKHTCGFYYNPEQPTQFVEQLSKYVEDRSLILQHQKNSRELAQLYFSRKKQTELLNQLINKETSIASLEKSVYTLTA